MGETWIVPRRSDNLETTGRDNLAPHVASNSRLPWQRCRFFLAAIHALFKIPPPQPAYTIAAYPAFRYPHAPSRGSLKIACEQT
jgi:hypothetical protein